MRNSLYFKAAYLSGLLMLAGCASSLPAPEKYSGFLKDYSGLEETTSASGKTIMRWVDPSFKTNHYDKVIFNPVTYFPIPKPTTQLGADTLDKILAYTNQQLKASAAQRVQLVNKPGPDTLIFRGAITAVDTSKQGLQFYEVIPVAMIVAGTEAATGHRTMETNLYFEGELIDSVTHKVVMRLVRKGEGDTVSNENTPITVDSLKAVIDSLATDASMFGAN